jgi:hypothetical protein
MSVSFGETSQKVKEQQQGISMSQIPCLPNIFRLTRGLRGPQCEHQAKARELDER